MRILFLSTEITPMKGGIQRYSGLLAETLIKICGQDEVFIFPLNGVYEEPLPFRLDDSLAKLKRPFGVIPRSWALKRRIEEIVLDLTPDLVICNHIDAVQFAEGALLKNNISYWVIAYGIEVWGNLSELEVARIKEAEKIISISHITTAQLIKKGIAAEKIHLLTYGIDTDLFKPAPQEKTGKEKKTLLTVCRLETQERYKGYDQILKVMQKLVQDFPELLYRIVGDGNDRERVQNLAKDLKLENHFEVTGFVDNAQKFIHYYQDADLFVMPSEFQDGPHPKGEGFGLVYLEANACGKAVIAGIGGGCREAVVDGETGFLIDPHDEATLYTKIKMLLEKPDLAKAMGEKGRARVEQVFSKNQFEKNVRELIHK